MRSKKEDKLRSNKALAASVTEEMMQRRITSSARIAELNLDAAGLPEPPSITILGTVKKIIPSPRRSVSESAEIAIGRADPGHRNLRIENVLSDEHGRDVKLKKGAHVNVIITAHPPTANRDKE